MERTEFLESHETMGKNIELCARIEYCGRYLELWERTILELSGTMGKNTEIWESKQNFGEETQNCGSE